MNSQVISPGSNCRFPSPNQKEQSSKAAICFLHLLIPAPKGTGISPLLPFRFIFRAPSARAQLPTPNTAPCVLLSPSNHVFFQQEYSSGHEAFGDPWTESFATQRKQNILWIRQTWILKFTLRMGKELQQTSSSQRKPDFSFCSLSEK